MEVVVLVSVVDILLGIMYGQAFDARPVDAVICISALVSLLYIVLAELIDEMYYAWKERRLIVPYHACSEGRGGISHLSLLPGTNLMSTSEVVVLVPPVDIMPDNMLGAVCAERSAPACKGRRGGVILPANFEGHGDALSRIRTPAPSTRCSCRCVYCARRGAR
eukprot:gnl/TRDRNA2_/TRDRNA2_45585_c0_seq1.p2 gnl/TRDRNA2_/TRDRNA2_45585_c0~~gnl/TRDRNA2_/TRDRNA2_45585_c0_seq1.p2  ORF type:complete len:164 (+),score=15.92 gnl/TRDRNA2_/TRDRNA2_45585_c0_seq1:210-701(+)